MFVDFVTAIVNNEIKSQSVLLDQNEMEFIQLIISVVIIGIVFLYQYYIWYEKRDPKVLVERAYKIPIVNDETNVPHFLNTALEEDIQRVALEGLPGVQVLWAPPGASKTVAVKYVASKLQKQNIDCIYHCLNSDFREQDNLLTIIASQVFKLEKYEPLIGLLPDEKFHNGHRLVMFLDNFDVIRNSQSIRESVRSLAVDGYNSQKYMVIALVRDLNFAHQMVSWNGHQKIFLLGNPSKWHWERTSSYQELE